MTIGIARFMDALERTWDAHLRALYVEHDADAALAEMVAEPSLHNLPMMTGAEGRAQLHAFLREDLLGHLPDDLVRTRVSKTVDRWRLVDETTVSFTHDRELPWLAPGLEATHRTVEALVITIVRFDGRQIAAQKSLWDHAALRAGLGIGEVALAQ